ncbi:iron-sulfur oxidoreductase [Mycolicibacterium tokaiense]|uniref:Iron-sulfur oxidoreductase n=1 Tax=Mycolicibacterium tokaiense TaxID=39695 RepID=A0A378TFG0_9MYCO|nr:iron-sulfur oxidoreductase [Mycolicibacterium tokaiense]
MIGGPQARGGNFVIAVALAPASRGGSVSMHTSTEVGMFMQISPPVDAFPLRPASQYLLIAGGIGITAMRSMFYAIQARGDASVTLVYLVRSRSEAPYMQELLAAADGMAHVFVHATDEHAGERFDLWSVLKEPSAGRVYCCASPTVIEAVRSLTAHWRASRVHFEDFAGVDPLGGDASPFTAVWEPTGQVIHVPADSSLHDALTTAGISVPVSCRAGTCGTCRVRIVSGDADHRDVILDDAQRETQLTSCVSRGHSTITIAPYADNNTGFPSTEQLT